MNDQINRHHRILEKLQNCRSSNPVSVPEVLDFLLDKGIDVSARTVQRDMNALAEVFMDIESKILKDGGFGWYWNDKAKVILLSGLSANQALSFILVKKYLSQLFPEATLKELEPFFEYSEKVLHSLKGNALVKWPEKIAVVHPVQPLLAPEINGNFQKIISTALLENKKLKLDYVRLDGERSKYTVNPVGLVFRGHVIYLIAVKVDTGEQRQFALHRIKKAEQLPADADPITLTLQEYLEQGNMGFAWNAWNTATSLQEITFKCIFEAKSAKYLTETPLSKDQEIIPYQDGYVIVKATVRYTEQLVWWIRGYGSAIEVLEPLELRERMIKDINELHTRYQ
ncbi:MAG: WYL domain-containing protein [Methylococcales bacterium]|nr:WYL domain-containing protein [Methylococcales bacterium]